MLRTIVFLTLGQLATGILLFIGFVPPSSIGKGFGRFHALLALGLWMLAVWGNFSTPFYLLAALLLITAFASTKNSLFYPFLGLSFLCSLWILAQKAAPGAGLVNAASDYFPGVLVLGASSVSMLLGHWYLVAPKLPITYLKTVTMALIFSILLRLALVVGMLLKHQVELGTMHFYEMYGIFFIQRILLGLLLTLALSILTYFCVRIRSTQSATGILYVVVVFCLIGEVIGSYLFEKTGILF